MNFPDLSLTNSDNQWERFCQLLWFSDELGIWLDISRMNITASDFKALKNAYTEAFKSMKQLEQGSLANKDENRMVGHYWLRSPSLAPSDRLSNLIVDQIDQIEDFGKAILNGDIKTDEGNLFTDVIWIGIGGSGLGPMLIINSLKKDKIGLNFHFLDNIDPNGIKNKLDNIGKDIRNTLVVVVSKSGGTPEPKLCMEQSRKFIESQGHNWQSRAIAITMQDSNLDNLAKEEGWLKRFELPDWVGGRTSITSAVGLLPLSFIKTDIREFLKGANIMDKYTRLDDIYQNPAALLATSWFTAGKGKGLKDLVILPYSDSLEVFSRYLQQLIMESLGKKYNRSGILVNQGLAVYGNKGSTDQHAYVQQLRDGIDNFFATFIEVLSSENELPGINNQSPRDYLSGFLQGTRLALSESNRQNITITLKDFNALTLGALIALFERTVGLYAELIDINAYDQPGVEAGKKAAANILEIQNEIEELLSNKKEYRITEIISNLNIPLGESAFMIIRNIVFNNTDFQVNGNWNNPESLVIRKVN